MREDAIQNPKQQSRQGQHTTGQSDNQNTTHIQKQKIFPKEVRRTDRGSACIQGDQGLKKTKQNKQKVFC